MERLRRKRTLFGYHLLNYWADSLPADKGIENRLTMRLYTFLKIVALARSHVRMRLVCGKETMVIADIKEDLHEALHLTQNRVGIPVFKLEMFRNVLIPAWKKLEAMEAQNDKDIEVGDQEAEKRSLKKLIGGERMLVLTANLLCQQLKVHNGRIMTTANMKRTYLDEFVNAGLIDEEELIDGRRTKVWYPIVDLDVYDGKSEKSDAFKMPIGCEFDESTVERLRNITQHNV